MQASRDEQADDLVTRAVQALRQAPLPDGPSAATVSETLAAVREAASRPKTLIERVKAMPWTSKTAAVVGLAASGFVMWAVLTSPAGSAVALAQVVEKLVTAQSLSIEMEVQPVSGKGPATKVRVTFTEPNKMRGDVYDVKGDELMATLISDPSAGKGLLLSPKAKVAIVSTIKGGDQGDLHESFLGPFRALAKKSSRSLGVKQVEGIEAKGFEIENDGVKVHLWADVKTGDPVRLEMFGFLLPPPFGQVNVVMRGFKINEQIDPKLFSVEPPEGYKVIQSPFEIDMSASPAEHVVTILRVYSKRTGGELPARLNDQGESIFTTLEQKGIKTDDKSVAEDADLRTLQLAIRQLNFYFSGHKSGRDYQHYPGGKLGEKDRIVFWYCDKKTGEYRAVYGDLRVEKVEKGQLPASRESGSPTR